MKQPTAETKPDTALYSLFWLLTAGFVAVTLRLVFIQWVNHDLWLLRADRSQEKTVTLEAQRGTIYDRNGIILAMNVDRASVYAEPSAILAPRNAAKKLSALLGIPRKTLLKKFRQKNDFAWLKRKIDPQIKRKIEALKIQGIHFATESKRIYPKGPLFGQLIGFAGLDNQGLEGVESKHDAILRGQARHIVFEKDGRGKIISPKDFQYASAAPGQNLHLTVDQVIQHISQRELDRMVKKSGAKGGTVIVMDPWSGEVLAMAISPAFDPNARLKRNPRTWRNRAISDFYEPGSTFKIITAAAALEEGVVHPEQLIDCLEGAYRIKGGTIHDHKAVGIVSFSQVIAKSSNIGTVKVAELLGKDKFSDYIDDFGFGKRLGIALHGESPGLVNNKRNWSGRSLASVAIGQEVGVTPLQMVTAASVIANGGWLMTPKIVKSIEGTENHITTESKADHRVLSTETTRQMTEILKAVVSPTGTAVRAAVSGYTVAGKTGTAQKIDPETKAYSKDKVVSSFVGFVPANDPLVTILVALDEPEGKGWGGEIAAPVFSRVAEDVLYYLRIPPDQKKKPTQATQQFIATQPLKPLPRPLPDAAIAQTISYTNKTTW